MQTDIEIYLLNPDVQQVVAWLAQRFDSVMAQTNDKLPATAWSALVQHGDHQLPVMLVLKASSQFASLWFNSPHSPWADDLACAQDLHAALGFEVRCSPSGWEEGQESELWYQLRHGQLNLIPWK